MSACSQATVYNYKLFGETVKENRALLVQWDTINQNIHMF